MYPEAGGRQLPRREPPLQKRGIPRIFQWIFYPYFKSE